MKKGKNDRKILIKQIFFICLAVILFLVLVIVLYNWEKNNSFFGGEYSEEVGFEIDGQEYELRKDIETVLVMGLDKFEESIDNSSYNNDQQADFLMLLVLDHSSKTCSAIHINRDTMAEITVLGIGGKKVGTVTEQLALAHTYGSGSHDSCRNTVRAVSDLLFNIDVDHYVSLTMDAVSTLNDLVGGVTVTVLDDFTFIDSELKKGDLVTLMGDQALIYVRNRYGVGDNSNATRMKRQQQYMKELYLQTLERIEKDSDFPNEVVSQLADYTVTNCSVNQIGKLLDNMTEYEIQQFYTLDGELTVGEKYMEFNIDKSSAKRLVADMFYKIKK